MEYLITFIEGIASFISPCILPVIPIYISYFATESKSMKKSIINSLGFVCGFSIIFILLGVFAGTFGKFVHEYTDYINIIFGIFLIIIGLNYIGALFIKFLNNTKGTNQEKKNLTFITSVLFGIIFSLSYIYNISIIWNNLLIIMDPMCWSLLIIRFNIS